MQQYGVDGTSGRIYGWVANEYPMVCILYIFSPQGFYLFMYKEAVHLWLFLLGVGALLRWDLICHQMLDASGRLAMKMGYYTQER